MSETEIVEEVHRTREKLWRKYGGTMESFMAEMRKQTEEARRNGRKVAGFAPKPARVVGKKLVKRSARKAG